METGEVIKMIMKKRGFSQKQLAEKIDKTPAALSLIINGVTKPQSETLESIAKILDVPVPVIHFLSINEDEVPPENLKLFRTLAPTMEKYLMDVFDASREDLNLKEKAQ